MVSGIFAVVSYVRGDDKTTTLRLNAGRELAFYNRPLRWTALRQRQLGVAVVEHDPSRGPVANPFTLQRGRRIPLWQDV